MKVEEKREVGVEQSKFENERNWELEDDRSSVHLYPVLNDSNDGEQVHLYPVLMTGSNVAQSHPELSTRTVF